MWRPSLLPLLALLVAPQASTGQDGGPKPRRRRPPSILASPLFRGELPPEVRSLRNIQLTHAGAAGAAVDVTRTREEVLELARHLVTLVRSGEDFVALAREYSAAENAAEGALLGTFCPGVLLPAMDAFLLSAEIGDVSEPIVSSNGVHVLQRIETFAATLHILIRDDDEGARGRAEDLAARLRAGADFAGLARENSEDPYSAPRGGEFQIFERGPRDGPLEVAAFELALGEIAGPIETTRGFHILKRVPLGSIDVLLRERTFVRVRAILVAHRETGVGVVFAERTAEEAEALARELWRRIRSGEDMAELAGRYNDDSRGRRRHGDLGWIHRGNPRTASVLERSFKVEPGELLEPVSIQAGWVIVRREK